MDENMTYAEKLVLVPIDFDRYDDPVKARLVWEDYRLKGVKRVSFDRCIEAKQLGHSLKKYRDLDIALDRLVSRDGGDRFSFRTSGDWTSRPGNDEDAFGFSPLITRILEDGL